MKDKTDRQYCVKNAYLYSIETLNKYNEEPIETTLVESLQTYIYVRLCICT